MFKKLGIICVVFVLLVIAGQTGKAEAAESAATTTAEMSTSTPKTVESQVREYFADTPVMIEIARCESNFRQFNDSGSVLRGGSSGAMIGIFQFFESVHSNGALVMGFDLVTVEGNMGYAKYLYQQSGTKPWSACVPKVITSPSNIINISTSDTAKLNQIKLLNQLIVLLKQLIALQAQLVTR